MANRTISISYKLDTGDKGFKKLVLDAKDFENALGGVAKRVEGLNAKMFNFANFQQGIESFNKGLSDIQAVFSDFSKAYAVQEEAETKLTTVMRERMGATDAMIQGVKDLCSEQQKLGVIGDEVQLAGAQQLSTFLRQEESLRTLIPAMNNLVAQQKGYSATGGDAVNIGNLLGKAMQGQTSALRRVGITFTEAEEKAVKYGDEQERAAALARIITNNVGQMNQQLAQTPTGQLKQVENFLGDVKEQIGGLIKDWMPYVTALNQGTLALTNFIKIGSGIKSIIAMVKGLTVSMGGATAAATALKVAIGSVALLAIAGAIWGISEALKSATSETERLQRAQKAVNDIRAEAASRVAEQTAKIDILIRTAQDEQNSLATRKKAIDELNRIIPNYNAHLDKTTNRYKANANALKEYNEQLLRKYEIEGAENELRNIAKEKLRIARERLAVEKELDVEKNMRVTAFDRGPQTSSGAIPSASFFASMGSAGRQQSLENKLADLDRQEKAQDEAADVLFGLINDRKNKGTSLVDKLDSTNDSSGSSPSPRATSSSPSSASSEPEAPKGSLAYLKKQQQELEQKISFAVDENEKIALIRQKHELGKEIQIKVKFMADTEEFFKFCETVRPELNVKTNVDIKDLTDQLGTVPEVDTGLSKELEESAANMQKMQTRTQKTSQLLQGLPQVLNTASSAFSGLGEAFDSKELNVAGIIAGAIANIVSGYAAATSQASSAGPWAWAAFAIAGLAEVAAVISQVKNLTAFAEGGIVSGPTMALVGEYSGASNNPEVIAPLNKLKAMLDSDSEGSGPVNVRFVIEGSNLVGVLNNTTRISARSRRRSKIK